ncbi:MAG: hypothetical protein IJW21_06510 [Clostridia bacterium]|nr:hypothetical protein [Clostridia bacterium]
MRKLKNTALIALMLCAVLALTSCNMVGSLLGGMFTDYNIKLLVQGNLDETYLGKVNEAYLELIESNEAESEEYYLECMEADADYFAYYWGIIGENEAFDILDEALRARIVDLCKRIYSHSKYTVESAEKQSDGGYVVKVIVEPVDIMKKADELYESGTYAPLEAFFDKSDKADWANMTEAQYIALCNEYGNIIVDMFETLMPDIGHEAAKSLLIQVNIENDYWEINDDDFRRFDEYVVIYP